MGNANSPQFLKKKKRARVWSLLQKKLKIFCMNFSLLFEWLVHIDNEVGNQERGKILLLMDSCSSHDSRDTMPTLESVEMECFSLHTTSKLQPLRARVIALMKAMYRRRQMKDLVDLLDVGVADLFNNDILTAMR